LPKGINKLVRNGETIRFKWLSRNEAHIFGWILVVSSLLTWHQWMKQPTIAKKQIKGSHVAEQWLMRLMATVAPRTTGMTNNTIKKHVVLHLCEDILNHGVPDNVNSAYPESAHIPLAKITSRNTQKRAVSFTKQAAHCYVENLVVSLASADVVNDINLKEGGRTDTQTPQQQHLTHCWPAIKRAQYLAVNSPCHGSMVMNPPHSSGIKRDPPMIQRSPDFHTT
jgi:hypothetical protein